LGSTRIKTAWVQCLRKKKRIEYSVFLAYTAFTSGSTRCGRYNLMTKIEVKEFVMKTTVEVLKKQLHGLDRMNKGDKLNDFTDDEKELLISLRDEKQTFRLFANPKIEKSEVDAERRDMSQKKVLGAQWGKAR